MGQSLVSIRMDDNLKKQFDSICTELGLNMTSAVTIFAKKVVREKGIPFSVSFDPFYSDSNIREIHESLEQFKSCNTVSKTMSELEDMANE